MMRKTSKSTSTLEHRHPPALTPEERQNQMISLAVNLAEKQLAEGTASSQVITHYLKLGTVKEKLELERLQQQNELLKAKTESLKSAKRVEELYLNAMQAMKAYGYQGGQTFDEDPQVY